MDKLIQSDRTNRNNVGRLESLSLSDSTFQSNESTFSLQSARTSSKITELDSVSPPTSGSLDLKSPKESFAKLDGTNKEPTRPIIEELDSVAPLTFTDSDEVLAALKDKPNAQVLVACLEYLVDRDNSHGTNIRSSDAKAAQVLNVLVNDILPNYWPSLAKQSRTAGATHIKRLLLDALRSIAGVGALLASLKSSKIRSGGDTRKWEVQHLLECLAQLLEPNDFVYNVLNDIVQYHVHESQQRILWHEFVSTIVGGRLLSLTSEAVFTTRCLDADRDPDAWVADGRKFASWLGRNLNFALFNAPAGKQKSWTMIAQFVKRCITMPHSDLFVGEVMRGLIFDQRSMWTPLGLLFENLMMRDEHEMFFKLILDHVCSHYLPSASQTDDTSQKTRPEVGAVATIISSIIGLDVKLENSLVTWLCSGSNGLACSFEARRASIAALGDREERLRTILDRTLKAFGDKLHIQHTPIMQQEALAQIILLATGSLYRLNRTSVSGLSRSSSYLQAVSNRLASSIPRARILGMIVGTAISQMLEASGNALRFDMEELETPEAQWYMNITQLKDDMGSITALKVDSGPTKAMVGKKRKVAVKSNTKPPIHRGSTKVIAIEELSDTSQSEDDLVPYEKPDEDPEDFDDDPTLLNRSKSTAPVYIKDLISGLQANDKPEVFDLALKTAPALIRRKANFGTELVENTDRLAAALINAQDGMNKQESQNLRLQSMIACVVAQPSKMAPWFIRMYFEGDISQAQRATILTAVGLGARELAGFEDAYLEIDVQQQSTDFPSKRLPPKLEAIYSQPRSALGNVAKQIEHATLRPMALAAADEMTGPDVLKVRTFSSRMEVERKTQQKEEQRKKKIPRDLHKLLSQKFYLELCGRLDIVISGASRFSSTHPLLDPILLRLSLQTLLITLSSLGPNALDLPTVTRETFLILTTLHNTPQLALDPAVLPCILTLLLQTLDINVAAGATAEERLITEHGNVVAELVSWAGGVSERVSVPEGGGGEEGEMPWTVVAAGVQVKWAEVGTRFQGRLLGLGPMDF